MLLLVAGFGVLFSVLPKWVTRVALAVQVLYWALIWVAAVWKPHHMHWAYFTLSVLSTGAFAAALFWLHRHGDTAPAVDRPAVAAEPAAAV